MRRGKRKRARRHDSALQDRPFVRGETLMRQRDCFNVSGQHTPVEPPADQRGRHGNRPRVRDR
jgi:hypothetical protein